MDDDAFFGNYNISINYYHKLLMHKGVNDNFLILPMDYNQALVFSNFAFFINTTNTVTNRSINFLYDWFEGSLDGFQFYDQDSMNYAILKYLIKYDYKFKDYLNKYLIHEYPFKYLLFLKDQK